MKISKEFRWEMGHRLPNHSGLCRNIHGHSYKMIVVLAGEVLKNGMIIDFYDLGLIIKPIVSSFDHAFLVTKSDRKVLEFLTINKMKKIVVDYPATVENISTDLANRIASAIRKKKIKNVSVISVKIYETPNSYAEASVKMK